MRNALAAAFCALAFLVAVRAHADPDAPPEPSSTAAIEKAKQHFDRALEQYRTGDYRDAIGELEKALLLDPEGKDLVYNLALVYEKLGDLDNAISNFRRFVEMEDDPEEKARIEGIVRRLEGAREKAPASSIADGQANEEKQPASPVEGAERGRLDGWVYATGGVAAAALVVGSIFGVRALTSQASEGTGIDDSVDDLQARQDRAHKRALVADVMLGVSAASATAAAGLYFFRSAEPAEHARVVSPRPRPRPRRRSFGVGVRGTF